MPIGTARRCRRFLVNAQRPLRLATLLSLADHDALHTSQLTDGNQSTDAAIVSKAGTEDRLVVTTDGDVRDEHLLNGKPRRLLPVRAENISNTALLDLIKINIDAIIRTLEEVQLVELSASSLIVYDDRQ